MAEPFKNHVDGRAVAVLTDHVAAVYPEFPSATFQEVVAELGPLELKDRVRRVATALRASLPSDWAVAVRILTAALPEWKPADESLSAGFWLWPVLQVVEDHGDDPELSLPALHAMTSRFSAEFAIRPYLERHPDATWTALATWADDPDPHVRRLVSEGSRSRLPWGKRLTESVRDPSRGLALLDRLVDDPSPYVRRSVANHLGDVAKDHPERAIAAGRRWLAERPEREDTVKHGLRALLKAGDADALALFGHADVHVHVDGLQISPRIVSVGDTVEITAHLRVDEPAHVRVDVVWQWPGARGWASKTFRGGDRELAPGEVWIFRHRLSMKPVTTRPTRPGTHRITLRVLGTDVGPVEFTLRG